MFISHGACSAVVALIRQSDETGKLWAVGQNELKKQKDYVENYESSNCVITLS
jgi:hypothetical protein